MMSHRTIHATVYNRHFSNVRNPKAKLYLATVLCVCGGVITPTAGYAAAVPLPW